MNVHELLHQTAHSANLNILSDDACCRLLAWTYAYAGQYEAVVKNQRLNADIAAAQRQLGIGPGTAPNADTYQLLRSYLKQVRVGQSETFPDWAQEINKNYNLTPLK